MEFTPVPQRTSPNLYGYKKGASRCIYQGEALHCPRTINANDPRPERAVAKISRYADTTNRDTPKNGIPA